jgi:hypothetical protein
VSSPVPFNHFNHYSYLFRILHNGKLARMYGWRTAWFGLGPLGLDCPMAAQDQHVQEEYNCRDRPPLI